MPSKKKPLTKTESKTPFFIINNQKVAIQQRMVSENPQSVKYRLSDQPDTYYDSLEDLFKARNVPFPPLTN